MIYNDINDLMNLEGRLTGLRRFSSNENLTLSEGFKKFDIIRRKVLRKSGWFLARLAYHRESSGGGSHVLLRSISCICIRKQKSHCTGYEYFKDSLIVYTDISYFDLTVVFLNKNIISITRIIIRRWRNPGFSVSKFLETLQQCLRKSREYLNTIKRYFGRVFIKFERVEGSFENHL